MLNGLKLDRGQQYHHSLTISGSEHDPLIALRISISRRLTEYFDILADLGTIISFSVIIPQSTRSLFEIVAFDSSYSFSETNR